MLVIVEAYIYALFEIHSVRMSGLFKVFCTSVALWAQKKCCLILLYLCQSLRRPAKVWKRERYGMQAFKTIAAYYCSGLCTSACHFKKTSWSYVKFKEGNSTIWAVAWHSRSEVCASRNSSNVGASSVAICVVVVYARAATPDSVLFIVSTVSSHYLQGNSKSECLSWSSMIFAFDQLMTPSSLVSNRQSQWYLFHLFLVAIAPHQPGCPFQLYARHQIQFTLNGFAQTPISRWCGKD